MTTEVTQIRCKDCGYTVKPFHGWVFAITACSKATTGYKSMLHRWEEVVA